MNLACSSTPANAGPSSFSQAFHGWFGTTPVDGQRP